MYLYGFSVERDTFGFIHRADRHGWRGPAARELDFYLHINSLTQTKHLQSLLRGFRGRLEAPYPPAHTHPGGVWWSGLAWLMSPGCGSSFPAAFGSASPECVSVCVCACVGGVRASLSLMTQRVADIPTVNTHPPLPLPLLASLPPCAGSSSCFCPLLVVAFVLFSPTIHSWLEGGRTERGKERGGGGTRTRGETHN